MPAFDRTPSAPHAPGSAEPRSVAVIGAGMAGAQTVAALRRRGFLGTVTIVGAEGIEPYDRPPLSKELLTRTKPLWLRDDLGIDVFALADNVRLSDPARTLMRSQDGWTVETDSSQVTADAVVLATGAAALKPPALQGALTLHTADDASRLRRLVRPGSRMVIVGAGWIGAEVAGVCAADGVHVTVIEMGGVPLWRQIGNDVGARMTRWYADAGIELLTGKTVTQVDAHGVLLGDGKRIAAEVVLAAVGARPATDWLKDAIALTPSGAIEVDADGQVPGVTGLWAVGDCANRLHIRRTSAVRVPGGHWSAALHDPDSTVAAMLGQEVPRTQAPYVFSRQLGHDLALFGSPAGDVVFRGGPEGPWSAFYTGGPDAGGAHVVNGVLLVDSPRDVGVIRRAFNAVDDNGLRREPLIDPNSAADPSVPLKQVIS